MTSTSYLGEIIYDYLALREMTIKDLAEKVPHANSSTISKIRHGDFARLSNERLQSIIDVIAPKDPIAQCEIISAYLEDLCPKAYRHRLRIEPRTFTETEGKNRQHSLHHLLDTIGAAAAQDEAFMKHLQSLSKLAESINTPT